MEKSLSIHCLYGYTKIIIYSQCEYSTGSYYNSKVKLFDDLRYYKLGSESLGQDDSNCLHIKSKRKSRAQSWTPPPEGWIMIKMNAFRRDCIKSISVGVIMRNNRWNFIMANIERIGDCSILVPKCLIMRKAILVLFKTVFCGLLFRVTPSY